MPIESPIRVTVPVIGAVAGFVLVVRRKASLDAFAAGHPVPPLLPEVTVPWKTVGVAAGTLLLTVMTALLVLSCRIVSQARQDDQRRRAALEARHDRVLEDLGARLADDPACPFLDEPPSAPSIPSGVPPPPARPPPRHNLAPPHPRRRRRRPAQPTRRE